MASATRKRAADLTDAELAHELHALGEQFDAPRDDESHGGSPGEWMVERMGELEQEQKIRLTAKGPTDG